MRVALINPRSNSTRVDSRLRKVIGFYPLTLPVLASFVPENVELKVFDELVEKVPMQEDFDLVGISVSTPSAPRAYDLSKHFRSRGSKVVLGGIHPTVMQDEALSFSDAVVLGRGEEAWSRIIQEIQAGRDIQGVYRSSSFPEVKPRREVYRGKSFYILQGIQATRGCVHNCDFCSVPLMSEGKFEKRGLDLIVEDIQSIESNYFFFVDDNLFADRRFAKELFRRIIPLNKRWVSQAPINISEDDELLRLAYESGGRYVYLGVESISQEGLGSVHKTPPKNLVDALNKIKNRGIEFELGFIFGLDTDTEGIFDATLEFVNRIKPFSVNYHALVPYPGTPVYQRLKEEGRLIYQDYPNDWQHYFPGDVVFVPKNMSPERLQEGVDSAWKDASSLRNIVGRILSSNHPIQASVFNLGYTFRKNHIS